MKNYVIRRSLAGILAATVVVMGFSGCGGAANTNSTDKADTTVESADDAEETADAADDTAGLTEVAETSDGIYGTYLRAGDKDQIGTTDDNGLLNVIAYETSAEGDKLLIFGSMNYKNDRAQDPISVSDDEKHVFDVNDDTVFRLCGGAADPEVIDRTDFALKLQELADSGLYLEIEVSGGVIVQADLCS